MRGGDGGEEEEGVEIESGGRGGVGYILRRGIDWVGWNVWIWLGVCGVWGWSEWVLLHLSEKGFRSGLGARVGAVGI